MVFGMGLSEFALIVVVVLAVVLRLVNTFVRHHKIRRSKGDDREWWEL